MWVRPFFKQMNFKRIVTSFAGTLLLGCGAGDDDRPETVTKLRALGVEQTPVNAKPGDTVNLAFYLAVPSDQISTQPVLATVQTDPSARYGVAVAVTPVDAAPVETKIGTTTSLLSYRTTLAIPNDARITAAIAKQGFARVRYNVKFSNNTEEENVVGDAIIYADGAPQLAWKSPEIAITKPGESSAAGSIDLEGTINAFNAESNRVSWFTSSGKVKNRRAKVTSWTDQTPGSQAVIMTVRGSKSGAFAIKSQAVTIN